MKPRFISDIHLSENNPHLTDAFKVFLNESKEACTHLFILGDLFEIWIGDDYDNSFIQDIKKTLIDFTLDGPETFLMHGNRDFLIGEAFANEVGISILSDPYTLDINSMKAILSHGDFLCTDDSDSGPGLKGPSMCDTGTSVGTTVGSAAGAVVVSATDETETFGAGSSSSVIVH